MRLNSNYSAKSTMRSPGFTADEVRRWNASRQGCITQKVRGSHVDIYVRLYQWGERFFYACLVGAGFGLLFMAYQIVSAFISGRVHEILGAALKAGQ